jgi:hypothetical protein
LFRAVSVLNREMLTGTPLPCENVVCCILIIRRSPVGERAADVVFHVDGATVADAVCVVADGCCELKAKMPSPATSKTIIIVNAMVVEPIAVL